MRGKPYVERTLVGLLLGLVVVGALVAPTAVAAAEPSAGSTGAQENETGDDEAEEPPIEEAYDQPAPEKGDEYYEASDPDGEWISYDNPRDEYRDPYLGDGSGKICTTLLNEEGEPIVGESVPNTTVTIPTGDTIEWHSGADPMTVEYPLTEHYEWPLDSDQFGTDEDLPQGDGIMDSHCIEFHGPDENATIEYGEAEVSGEYADRIEVVGYIQQANEAWDTDVDPIEDAVSYEEAGGGWTYEPDGSHGQAVVVLQLDPPEDAYEDGSEDENESESENGSSGNESTDSSNSSNATDENDGTDGESDGGDGGAENALDEMPGFGVSSALVALVATVVVARMRGRR
ncbi:PGF-CTERM sorting domain-containing protein [Natrialbaceae archaeon GCM10025810]|uniref:PGF-CTERM sorting domain-containing protein n=1 Tax=Halovalidus salilacus TaxID=3075124 RepID=UPI003614C246